MKNLKFKKSPIQPEDKKPELKVVGGIDVNPKIGEVSKTEIDKEEALLRSRRSSFENEKSVD